MAKFIEIKEGTLMHSINIDFIISIAEDTQTHKSTIYMQNREIGTDLTLEKLKVLIANASPF